VIMTFADTTFTDGNALAGPLRELFALEMTSADGRCATCGRTGPVADLRVYGHENGPGLVARCPGCEEIVLRLVVTPERVWLDLRGLVSLAVIR